MVRSIIILLPDDSKVVTRAKNVFTNFDVEYENIYVSQAFTPSKVLPVKM